MQNVGIEKGHNVAAFCRMLYVLQLKTFSVAILQAYQCLGDINVDFGKKNSISYYWEISGDLQAFLQDSLISMVFFSSY